MIKLTQLLNEIINEEMADDNQSPVEESKVGDDAKRMGLTYMRFGRYGKDGKVTHKSVGGKLQPVKGGGAKAPAKAPAKTPAKAPAKTPAKAPAKAPAKSAPAAKGNASTPAAREQITKDITRTANKLFNLYDSGYVHNDRYSGVNDAVKRVSKEQPKTRAELKKVIQSVIDEFDREADAEGAIIPDDWYAGVYDFQDEYVKRLG